ncbi:alpha/beta hydrolase [Williamsia deligens]|uniref:Alpha/beta hydrolase n=1 Tax=Williamsia deligens TaxID=321325 RepID=A0ABW3GCP3_9NOCA|nr:alpha/beta hydrolase family protein [Williamsia deligens]
MDTRRARISAPARLRRRTTVATCLAIAVSSIIALSVGAPAAAAPGNSASAVPAIVADATGRDGVRHLSVFSPAMRERMAIDVLPARDPATPHPTVYLLNGAQGGLNGSSWFDQTDIRTFFADKNVTVVVPVGGQASYFADWERDDPVLGHQKWTTFLTRELPPVMDAEFGGNGRNALGGISMAGTSVLQLAIAAPGLYRAVGAYSGCAQTSDPMGEAYVRLTVARGGGNADNLYGPVGDPEWARHDPYVNAEKLRGTALYVSAATGAPGPYDRIDGPGIDGNVAELVSRIGVGAVIESSVRRCTVALKAKLERLDIPATFSLPLAGTHSWPYWQDSLHRSWPLFARALGI